MSAAPLNASAINDTVKLREIPNTIVQIPNAVTHHSIVTPTRFRSGQYANRMAIAPAPTPGALRNNPNPHGPVCKISRAYTGSSATAPPSNTANKSREMAPRINFSRQIKCSPANTVFNDAGSRRRACGRVLIRNIDSSAPSAVTIAVTYTADGPPNAAYKIPPSDGPRIVAAWNVVAFHATALLKCSSGTSCGRIERLAVPLNERTTPSKINTA